MGICFVLRQLALLGSVSAELSVRLELTRLMIKDAHRLLKDSRAGQITLYSMLGATRFKYYQKIALMQVCCHRCRVTMDSYSHTSGRHSMKTEQRAEPESIAFLAALALKVGAAAPGVVPPIFEGAVAEQLRGPNKTAWHVRGAPL